MEDIKKKTQIKQNGLTIYYTLLLLRLVNTKAWKLSKMKHIEEKKELENFKRTSVSCEIISNNLTYV